MESTDFYCNRNRELWRVLDRGGTKFVIQSLVAMLNRNCKVKMGLGRADGVTRFVQVREDNVSKQAEGCRVKTRCLDSDVWLLYEGRAGRSADTFNEGLRRKGGPWIWV